MRQPESEVDRWRVRPACCETREEVMGTEALSLWYGAHRALADVSISLPRGCITAVVGPSGCGKSSFLAALNRLTELVPDCRVEGKITLDGAPLANLPVLGLRRRVGMIFQRPNPFPLSIAENVLFPLRHHRLGDRQSRRERLEQTLRLVGLWDEVAGRLDRPAQALSGGQQQRLCLARALALEPEVLLLDEPCSALDPLSSAVVEELIDSLRGRYTVVIVTHNLAQARRLADDVAVFWHQDGAGRLIEHGRAAEVFESPTHELTRDYLRGVRG
jgi:phosphate transport system ATP-binding protein